MSNRPTGVTILAILALIGGLLNLFFGGVEAVMGPMAIMGIGLLVVGVLQLVVAFGLFTLKGWAWMLAVVLQAIAIILNVFRMGGENTVPVVIATLVSVGILYYLFRPHVKQAFGRS